MASILCLKVSNFNSKLTIKVEVIATEKRQQHIVILVVNIVWTLDRNVPMQYISSSALCECSALYNFSSLDYKKTVHLRPDACFPHEL